MSLTEKVHVRFWRTMGERYGRRWFDEYGEQPTQVWRETLEGYTPNDIKTALDLLPTKFPLHPPSQPAFAQLLAEVAQKLRHEPHDYTREYWRSVVTRTCLRHAALLNIVPWGTSEMRALPSDVYEVAMRKCRELLDWACDTERKQGQRTPGIEQSVNAELWHLLKPYKRDEPPRALRDGADSDQPAAEAQGR